MDPETTQAVAKATEATAKAAGQGLEIVHDTGGYLKSVFGDLIVHGVGWLIGDWVGQKRLRHFDALCRRTLEILHERDVKAPIELSPNQAMDLLTGAQDEGRPELAELWARLLANAMDPKLRNVRHSFIEAVKMMDPPDVLVLVELYKRSLVAVARNTDDPRRTTIFNLATDIDLRPDDVEVSLRHLQSMGFLEQPDRNLDWLVTPTLQVFMRACYPEFGL
jgi:hypothetical protein